MAQAVTKALPDLAGTIQVVDQGGKMLTTTKSVFNAFKDAKAAYHARKAQILAERNLERERREAIKLAALEKEARRAERQKRRVEHELRKAERKELEASGVKAIEWKDGDKKDRKNKDKKEKEREKDKDKEAKKDRKKDRSEDGVLVVYDGDKKEKEKKERKHRHHSSHSSSSKSKESSKDKDKEKDKKRKGSTSSDGDSKALVVVPAAPLTPAAEDDFDFPEDDQLDSNQLRLPYDASVMSLAPALLQNVPGGSQAQQLLGLGQQMVSMMDPDGDSPLTALLVRLTDILDTFDCLNASITTLVTSLQKDPDALAMVGLTLAEISAVVAKTAPGVVVAAKAAFPVIFSLLASPQFLVTAGASVIVIGGYQIIRRVTGIGAPPTPKAIEEEDHLAFGPGMDDIHSEPEDLKKNSAPVAKTPSQPAPTPEIKSLKDKKKAMTFPPTPPLTPATEAKKELGNSSGSETKKDEVKERPKLAREGSKRQAIKSFLTRSHTMS